MNELEVLDIRLHEMDPVVDHFVIVEATETFRGNPKELTFAENLDRFAKFKNKIIHYIIDFHYETNNPWDRETFHRNSIIHALGCCEDEDIILISDVDEIVKAEGVKNIYQQLSQNPSQILGTSQKYHCYYLNSTPDPVIWRGTVATTYGALRKTTCQGVRDLRYLVPSAATGWHFTYQGGIERELYKISAFSHSELDTPEQKEKRKRDHLLGNRYSFIEIDESYPAYIRTNRAYFESIGFIRF